MNLPPDVVAASQVYISSRHKHETRIAMQARLQILGMALYRRASSAQPCLRSYAHRWRLGGNWDQPAHAEIKPTR